VKERSEKKAIVAIDIAAGGVVTVRAEAVAVLIPKSMEKP
jgi:hypothetical protein